MAEEAANKKQETAPPPKPFIIADLNDDPPETDGDDCTLLPFPEPITRTGNEESNLVKKNVMLKDPDVVEGEDLDQQCQGVSMSREEKVCSLKTGLVHVARKMPKNAHAHFLLGLMYQRLGQPQKAVLEYEKSTEILQRDEEENRRPDLLSLVLVHHAQCILQVNTGDNADKELETAELDVVIKKLKDSVQADTKHASVWNTLGLILLRTGRLQSASSVLSSLLASAPDYLDCLANLGLAYLQSGKMQLADKCFQDLILKDQNHPAALINYAAFLLCKYGSLIPGPGANAGEGSYDYQVEAVVVAKECLLAAVKADPKAAALWINLADVYDMAGDPKNAKKCLEQAAKLDPSLMPGRFAIAVHRIKDAERAQDSTELTWAANEMASILKEGDPLTIDPQTAWAGLGMAQRAQHEIASAFEGEQRNLAEAEDHALYTLKQAIEEDPNDAVQWHQLGLHHLCTTQFSDAARFLKAAVARSPKCSYAWSNIGIALQLSDDPSLAEEVYTRALSEATIHETHAIVCNLGNLYRQQKRFEHAKTMFAKALELKPGYAPAHNNLGLVFVSEGLWEDAISCFTKALQSDPLLDAAKSNMVKATSMLKISKPPNVNSL